MHRTIEDIKDEQTRLQQEIDRTANELSINKVNSMTAGGGPNKNNPAKEIDGGKAAANAEENRKKIKEIEASIMNLNEKFSQEIDNIKLMQTVSGG